MGNCVALSRSNTQIRRENSGSDSKLLRIFEMDGKVMESSRADYELKIGRACHVLPLSLPPITGSQDGESMRVKVVLTKKRLQELLSMNISLDELILTASQKEECSKTNSRCWKAELETIIEGNESSWE